MDEVEVTKDMVSDMIYEDRTRSKDIELLATALAEAQAVMKNAAMNRQNTFFNSKYATLSSIWDSVREALPAHGLSVTQSTQIRGDRSIILVTTLFHKSGQFLTSEFPI